MQVDVLLFAAAAQIVGQRSVLVSVDQSATVGDLAHSLGLTYPALKALMRVSRWAVDQEFVPLETKVVVGQEIALIPPVSGG